MSENEGELERVTTRLVGLTIDIWRDTGSRAFLDAFSSLKHSVPGPKPGRLPAAPLPSPTSLP